MLGHLSRESLAEVLRTLHLSGRSGQLSLRREQEERQVFLDAGEIVHVASSDPGDRIGQFLLARKIIGPEEYARALTEASQGLLFGQALVGRGVLTPADLEAQLLQFRAWLLARFLPWTDGAYIFQEGGAPVPPAIALATPYANLFLRAARQMGDPVLLLRHVGGEEQLVGFTTNPRLLFQNFALAPEEFYVISRIEGILTVREVLALTPLPRVKVLQMLYALIAAGVLETYDRARALEVQLNRGVSAAVLNLTVESGPAKAPAAGGRLTDQQQWHRDFVLKLQSRASQGDHYALFDLAKGATQQDIHARFLEYSKLVHPDNAFQPHLADLRPVMQGLLPHLEAAFSTLAESRTRAIYDRMGPAEGPADRETVQRKVLQQEIVQKNLEKAKEYMEQEDWHSAFQLLRDACRFDPDNPEVLLPLARVEMKNPLWARQAAERLASHLQGHPMLEEGWTLLAEIYLSLNLPLRARASAEKALEINPKNAGAEELLRSIPKEAR
jgi:tetratricopeptide (TPR) repeat protein